MLVEVRMTRFQGRKLSRIEVANAGALVGNLTLSSTRYGSASIGSLTLQARGTQTRDGRLGELYEPQLIALGHGGMRFRGIENIGGTAYVQEWLVEVLAR